MQAGELVVLLFSFFFPLPFCLLLTRPVSFFFSLASSPSPHHNIYSTVKYVLNDHDYDQQKLLDPFRVEIITGMRKFL